MPLLLATLPGALGAQQVDNDVARMSGVYAGELKGRQVRLWVTVARGHPPMPRHAAALLIFEPDQEQATRERMRTLADDPAQALHKVCAQVRRTESGYVYHHGYYRVWQSGGGIVLIRARDYSGEQLPEDWRQLEIDPYSALLENDEYIHLRDKEYAVREVRRDPRTGRLSQIQLSRTGFLQNPFDNPRTQLRFIGALPSDKLLDRYLDAKQDAAQVFFKDHGGDLPKAPNPACARP